MPHTAEATTTTRPDLDASNPLSAFAGYLEALETRLAALEALSEPEPLMTLSDAAEYARTATKTLQRAIRAGDLPTVGYVGRSPRLCREDIDGWLAHHQPASRGATSRPRRRRTTTTRTSATVDSAWSQLG
jgi:excisionase family DNA binding protein